MNYVREQLSQRNFYGPFSENRQLDGLKFRRQHPIDNYIVDFFCASCNLIVELDGESHNDREAYDYRREGHLKTLGFDVIRVSNDDVMSNLEGVAEFIGRATADRKPLP